LRDEAAATERLMGTALARCRFDEGRRRNRLQATAAGYLLETAAGRRMSDWRSFSARDSSQSAPTKSWRNALLE
jgi:hypothetical protein